MATKEQHNEWYADLRLLCNMFIAADKRRSALAEVGKSNDAEGINFLYAFKQHFAKVSLGQNSEMDGILGYEDMLDYAKWYVSGKDIIE